MEKKKSRFFIPIRIRSWEVTYSELPSSGIDQREFDHDALERDQGQGGGWAPVGVLERAGALT